MMMMMMVVEFAHGVFTLVSTVGSFFVDAADAANALILHLNYHVVSLLQIRCKLMPKKIRNCPPTTVYLVQTENYTTQE